jgi:polyketide synthase PksJ
VGLGAFSRGLTHQSAGRWIWLGPVLAEERAKTFVDGLSRTYGVPPSAIVVAASLLLFGRYHGVEDVGATIDAEGQAPGPAEFAVSVELSGAARLSDLVSQVYRAIVSADAAAPPLPESARPCRVILRNASGDNEAMLDRVAAGDGFTIASCFGLSGYDIRIGYRQGAHARWLASQFGQHLSHLLADGMVRPEIAANELTLLDRPEMALAIGRAIGPTKPYPLERSLLHIFDDQVRRSPDSVALIGHNADGGITRVSYVELDRRVQHLARRLARRCESRRVPIAVYMERSIEVVVALLATWRVGCIYVPLDSTYPVEYVRYILEDTGAALLVADTAECEAAPAGVSIVVCNGVGDTENDPLPDIEVSTGEPCLIMYTSGSTGRPKGVVHCQRQILNRLHWMWEAYPFSEGDVLAQRSPMSVMPSVWELLGGVLAGVPTVIVPDAVVRAPVEFADFLANLHVSFITMTPTLLRMLLQARQRAVAWPQSLRLVVIGGEPLTQSLYEGFRNAFPLATMVNDFGATEVNTVLHVPLHADRSRSIDEDGYRPISNVSTYILNDRMQVVPFGVEGELCIAGEAVALGYLNLSDATNERFVHVSPWDGPPAGRIYRTGDMGYMTPDGAIRITGRRDHQVKVNGCRVELGEIERVLRQHPAVIDCVLVDRPDPLSGRALSAYLVMQGTASAGPSDLRGYLRERVPPYMVPKTIERIDALPRRPNGKLDRMALRDRMPAPASTELGPLPGRSPIVLSTVRAVAARLIHADPTAIDPDAEFDAMGLDSVALVELARQLTDEIQQSVPVTMLFEHPTVGRLARYLTTKVSAGGEMPNRSRSAAGPLSRFDATTAVAIVGMSGRFPGAENIEQFWDNLVAGVESVGTVAFGRWDAESIYDPDPARERRSYSKWGGFLAGADQFDPQFFGYGPGEARLMDPQQRLCLMESWHALEDAGYTGVRLGDHHVGVFVGAREPDYPVLVANAGCAPNAQTLLGSDMSLLAARISYFCDLHGPSMVINTACSSALVAVHLACRSLRDDECTMALAGAVSLTNDPDFYVGTSKLKIFSPEGHCRTFDEKADGFVHGEGVGFVMLKRLDRAIADRDQIYAVIRGTAVNQDGRSNGITAPNQAAQCALQESLYRKLAIDPATIGYVESHGTATPLGDSIEIEALTRSFRRFTSNKQYCAIGSVKTNIGHLTAAAGIAGLIKSALCLNNRQLVPSLHFERPNPLLNFGDTPFYVNTTCRPWHAEPGAALRAAINAFGIGGTNAHAVLEEAPPDRTAGADGRICIIALTAPNLDAVSEAVSGMRRWIEQKGDRHTVRDLSFSLLVGRRLFRHGYLLLTASLSDLAMQISEIEAGTLPPTAFTMMAEPHEGLDCRTAELASLVESVSAPNLSPADRAARIGEVAKLIAYGARADMRPLYGDDARLISAPTCVFTMRRYWVDPLQAAPTIAAPLVHRAVTPAELDLREMIAKAAEELLGVVPRHDQPLTRYGMDSLKAISLQHALERTLSRPVQLERLLDSSTIDDLVVHLAGFRSAGRSPRQSDSPEDQLIERFLCDDLDLDAISDEQLGWLHDRMLLRTGATHGA